MVLRPSRGFIPVCVAMAIAMGGMGFGLFGYSFFAIRGLAFLSGGLGLAILPFWLEFMRCILHVAGSRLELDERGATWTRGDLRKRVEWGDLTSVSHGWMDQVVWEFRDAHGGVLTLLPGWYENPAVLKHAMQEALEGFARRLEVPDQATMSQSKMDRSIGFAIFGIYIALVSPLVQGLFTIPREFFPPAAYAVGWLFVLAATLFTAMGLIGVFRNRTTIDRAKVVRTSGYRTRTIPLSEVREAHHMIWARDHFLPTYRTSLLLGEGSIEFSSRDEGYFEAVRLIDTLVPSTVERREISRAAVR